MTFAMVSLFLQKLSGQASSYFYHETDNDHDHTAIEANKKFTINMVKIMSFFYYFNLIVATVDFLWLTVEAILLIRKISITRKIKCFASKTAFESGIAVESQKKQRIRSQCLRYFKKNPIGWLDTKAKNLCTERVDI